jgi:hypothetical protein
MHKFLRLLSAKVCMLVTLSKWEKVSLNAINRPQSSQNFLIIVSFLIAVTSRCQTESLADQPVPK